MINFLKWCKKTWLESSLGYRVMMGFVATFVVATILGVIWLSIIAPGAMITLGVILGFLIGVMCLLKLLVDFTDYSDH